VDYHLPNGNVLRHVAERFVGQGEYVPSKAFNAFLRATRSSPYLDRNGRLETIFVHVPRTAGTSIANALFEDGDRGHAPLYAYRAFDVERYRTFFKFAFVRNPYSRLVSAFHQVRESAHNPRVNRWADRYLSDLDGFAEFVGRLENNPSFRRVAMSLDHFRPQWELVTVGGEVGVDFLGKFERLEEDFRQVSKAIGVNASLPSKNSSSHDFYGEYYTKSEKMTVQRLYARDFRLFGYDASLPTE
jgi:hypothetical protein